jgi:hypothetical protein
MFALYAFAYDAICKIELIHTDPRLLSFGYIIGASLACITIKTIFVIKQPRANSAFDLQLKT